MKENHQLQLLVLRSHNVDRLRLFYESLGLSFIQEKHGKGPVHYSCKSGGIILELYPTIHDADTVGLGFAVAGLEEIVASLNQEYVYHQPVVVGNQKKAVLQDPDGRAVYVWENINK